MKLSLAITLYGFKAVHNANTSSNPLDATAYCLPIIGPEAPAMESLGFDISKSGFNSVHVASIIHYF